MLCISAGESLRPSRASILWSARKFFKVKVFVFNGDREFFLETVHQLKGEERIYEAQGKNIVFITQIIIAKEPGQEIFDFIFSLATALQPLRFSPVFARLVTGRGCSPIFVWAQTRESFRRSRWKTGKCRLKAGGKYAGTQEKALARKKWKDVWMRKVESLQQEVLTPQCSREG